MPSTSSKQRARPRRASPAADWTATLSPRLAVDLVSALPEPAYLADPHGALLFANPPYRQLRAVPIGATALPSAPPSAREAASTGDTIESEVTVSIDGRSRVLVGTHAPIFDDRGAVIAVGGVFRDVTGLREATSAATGLAERLDDLTRLMAEWTFEVDSAFRFRALSARALEALGRPPRALIGKGFLEVGAFAEDATPVPSPSSRSPFRDLVYRSTDAAGVVHHSRVSGVPVFDPVSGEFRGFRGIGVDISAQVAAEMAAANAQMRLMEAIESVSEGFALYDADDRLILCNSRFREFFPEIDGLGEQRISFESALRQMRCIVDVAADEREAAVQRRLAAHRGPEHPIEERLADDRWVLVNERPTRDGGIVSVYTEISELKRRERALAAAEHVQRDAREAAESANKAESAFLANISHELRTPLNAIIGFFEIMRNELFGPLGVAHYRDYVRDIHDSGKHLLNLINDILDFSKADAGKLVLHETDVSLPAVVARCQRLMVEIAHRGGVTLTCTVPDDCPPFRADERKIKQILLNLLSNAVKFTPAGGTVTTGARTEADGSLTLSVTDTGGGMRPEDIPKALAPFVQLEDPMTRRHQGTGLGLPLTKSLVELHGGTLRIESRFGLGTTVPAHFPAARVLPVNSETGAGIPSA